MGKKFLKTAESRALFVVIALIVLTLAVLAALIVTAFTAETWWEQPKKGSPVSPWDIWAIISQGIVFAVMVIGAIVALLAIIALAAEFFFGMSKMHRAGDNPTAPFRTLRDRNEAYDLALVRIRDQFKRVGRKMSLPFRKAHRAVCRWIDEGE